MVGLLRRKFPENKRFTSPQDPGTPGTKTFCKVFGGKKQKVSKTQKKGGLRGRNQTRQTTLYI